MKQLIKKALKAFAIPFVTHRVSVVKATYENEVMTIEYDNGKTEQYNGSCTVWHKMPMMQRCSTAKEAWLCDIWKYIKHYGNSYPNAHQHGG